MRRGQQKMLAWPVASSDRCESRMREAIDNDSSSYYIHSGVYMDSTVPVQLLEAQSN